mgnify:FL=1
MTDFLTTCTFLSDKQRQVLRDQDLDTAAAFRHVSVARLEAEPFKLTTGRAAKLLDAAGVGVGPAVASTINLKMAEPTERSERVDQALAAVHADPTKAATLDDLGIVYVVLQADDKLDVAQTKAMLAHRAAGAAVGMTWKGQRIVETMRLSTPTIWCSPPTGRPLQAGQDDKTDVPWGELGIDGLRLAFFGYREGMFGGLADEEVNTRIRDNSGLRERIAARMKAVGVKPEDMDSAVVFKPPQVQSSPAHPPAGSRQDAPMGALTGSLVGNLSKLLTALFGADELRRFIRSVSDDLESSLPSGGVSMATLAHDAADLLRRRGYINRALRDSLVLQRPRRVDDIDRVFSSAGV